jgi:hypothetical protein
VRLFDRRRRFRGRRCHDPVGYGNGSAIGLCVILRSVNFIVADRIVGFDAI